MRAKLPPMSNCDYFMQRQEVLTVVSQQTDFVLQT